MNPCAPPVIRERRIGGGKDANIGAIHVFVYQGQSSRDEGVCDTIVVYFCLLLFFTKDVQVAATSTASYLIGVVKKRGYISFPAGVGSVDARR